MEGSRRARDGPEEEETEDRRRSMGVAVGVELGVRERPIGEQENWVEAEGEERSRIGVFPDGLARICMVWFTATAAPAPPVEVPQGSAAPEESEFLAAGAGAGAGALVDSAAAFKGSALRGGDPGPGGWGEESR